MALHNTMGKIGEEMACRYLKEQGYEILDVNWKMGHWELDIIARKDGWVVFVEVKTRKNSTFGNPEDFVNRKKQLLCIKAANAYIIQHNIEEEARFDIIGVVLNETGYKIEHIPNAFNCLG
ncbi:MAG: YraN family protein [Bacteroidales bacterium]|nr:YraN family protein [Bacteroidales bacterium]